MKNTKCLVVTYGFFGDIMFATSLAPTLKKQYNHVDYLIGFPQMHPLVENNPDIDQVFVSETPGPNPVVRQLDKYDHIIELGPLNYHTTPCEEYHQQAGLEFGQQYQIYTNEQYDIIAQDVIYKLRDEYKKPVIGVMSNWQPKTYLFTPEQYEAGIDVPNLGYGGSHRDIQYIINELQEHFTLYPIGFDSNINQHHTSNIEHHNEKSLLFEASLLKYCDAFIGTEGGLANLAAGVGCRTILTGDFIHQLYGPNGVIRKIENPQLGPDKYFESVGHLMLNPYYIDSEVIKQIIESINNEK